VSLQWTASTDNVAVTGYNVYRDGAVVGTVGGSTTTFSDTTVAPATTYVYRVSAFDAAGNDSAQSDGLSVTTLPGGGPGTIVFTPVADTYVDGGVPASNYGTSTTLRADASPDRRSYLRFNVTGLSGTITSVKLRIYANSASSVGHDVGDVADDTWSETGMLYTDAPAVGAIAGSSGPFAAGGYVEVDVTSLVTTSGLHSFAIVTTSSTAISYASRESATDPELVVTTT
jgi:chitodextrinase